MGIDDGLELHVAVGGVWQEVVVVVRRRGLAVDEDAKLLGDDRTAAGGGGRGCGGGGGEHRHRGRRGRGVAAAACGVGVWEVDGGDVMDAGAALVLAAGVEADEVLLRMARHLRRRPARHEVARDVPPVPAPVLLQTHQEQPAVR